MSYDKYHRSKEVYRWRPHNLYLRKQKTFFKNLQEGEEGPGRVINDTPPTTGRLTAHVNIRLYTSAYVCIRLYTSVYVFIRLNTSVYVCIRLYTSAYVSIRQHTSVYVSIREHTWAYVSIRQHLIQRRHRHAPINVAHARPLIEP